MSDARYCKDCKNINCPENRVNCKYPDAIACGLYRDTPPTLFHQITASPEVLAEKLVFIIRCEADPSLAGWTSNVVQSVFETRSEAIAATVAKLSEVAK